MPSDASIHERSRRPNRLGTLSPIHRSDQVRNGYLVCAGRPTVLSGNEGTRLKQANQIVAVILPRHGSFVLVGTETVTVNKRPITCGVLAEGDVIQFGSHAHYTFRQTCSQSIISSEPPQNPILVG